MGKHVWRWAAGIILCALAGAAVAQPATPPITAGNVGALASVGTIDFDALPADAGEIASGWLRLSPDGQTVVLLRRDHGITLVGTDGVFRNTYGVDGPNGTFDAVEAAFTADGGAVLSLHTDGQQYLVARFDVAANTLNGTAVFPATPDVPVRVWGAAADAPAAWVEVMPADSARTPYVAQLAFDGSGLSHERPSAPEADADALVRVGRMPAPLAVTTSESGLVKVWDLERGTLLRQAQAQGFPVFGRVNGLDGRAMAWRDPESAALHLLNFVSGEDTRVANLDGAYIQALLLTPDADVILGVNVDLAPVVWAWDVATGERLDLGTYRACNRTPDMVQLSDDGTTLVIGCDTGLDVWRVPPVAQAAQASATEEGGA